MASLLTLQQERDERTFEVLHATDKSIAEQIMPTNNTQPTDGAQQSALVIQCAVRVHLAQKKVAKYLLQQFHQEEQLRKKKSMLQVTEGLALVDQAKLIQQMKDQLVLDRKKSVKTNHTELALELHKKSSMDGIALDDIQVDEHTSSSSSSSSSSDDDDTKTKTKTKEQEQEQAAQGTAQVKHNTPPTKATEPTEPSNPIAGQKRGRVVQVEGEQAVAKGHRQYVWHGQGLGYLMDGVPYGCAMGTIQPLVPVVKLEKGEPFTVVELRRTAVGPLGISKLYGRIELPVGNPGISGWVDLTTYKCTEIRTTTENGRGYAVKNDHPTEEDQEEEPEEDHGNAQHNDSSDLSDSRGGDNDDSSSEGFDGEEAAEEDEQEEEEEEEAPEEKSGKTSHCQNVIETEGSMWCRRVKEFQCSKEELLLLRNIDLKGRVRDLEVLLSQLSERVTAALTKKNELLSQTEILDITIGQLMERISPGTINIKTGKHKKGRSFPKPNTNRKHFDKL